VIAWQGAFVSLNLCHWRRVRRPGWVNGRFQRVRFLHDNQDMKPNATVTVTRESGDDASEFVLNVDGERLGSLDFARPEAGVLRIDYVEVAPELRGSGLGRRLVEAAVEWAREENMKIVPICGYARAVITRDAEMSKLLR